MESLMRFFPVIFFLVIFLSPVFLYAEDELVESRHGEWAILCDVPLDGLVDSGERCALLQNVVSDVRNEVGLSVVVFKTGGDATIMRVLAPLGVILLNGLGLNIDGEDLGKTPFIRCLRDGCYAEVLLDSTLLSRLRSGGTATFIIFDTPDEGIGIPVSLVGFSSGYAALPSGS